MISISVIEYFRYSRCIKRQAAQIESNREKASEKKENGQISIDSLYCTPTRQFPGIEYQIDLRSPCARSIILPSCSPSFSREEHVRRSLSFPRDRLSSLFLPSPPASRATNNFELGSLEIFNSTNANKFQ